MHGMRVFIGVIAPLVFRGEHWSDMMVSHGCDLRKSHTAKNPRLIQVDEHRGSRVQEGANLQEARVITFGTQPTTRSRS